MAIEVYGFYNCQKKNSVKHGCIAWVRFRRIVQVLGSRFAGCIERGCFLRTWHDFFHFRLPVVFSHWIALRGSVTRWCDWFYNDQLHQGLDCLGYGATVPVGVTNIIGNLFLSLDECISLFISRAVKDASFELVAATLECQSGRAKVATARSCSSASSLLPVAAAIVAVTAAMTPLTGVVVVLTTADIVVRSIRRSIDMLFLLVKVNLFV